MKVGELKERLEQFGTGIDDCEVQLIRILGMEEFTISDLPFVLSAPVLSVFIEKRDG